MSRVVMVLLICSVSSCASGLREVTLKPFSGDVSALIAKIDEIWPREIELMFASAPTKLRTGVSIELILIRKDAHRFELARVERVTGDPDRRAVEAAVVATQKACAAFTCAEDSSEPKIGEENHFTFYYKE